VTDEDQSDDLAAPAPEGVPAQAALHVNGDGPVSSHVNVESDRVEWESSDDEAIEWGEVAEDTWFQIEEPALDEVAEVATSGDTGAAPCLDQPLGANGHAASSPSDAIASNGRLGHVVPLGKRPESVVESNGTGNHAVHEANGATPSEHAAEDQQVGADLAAWVDEGGLFTGTVVAVRDDGNGRTTRPVWTVYRPIGGRLRLLPGTRVRLRGCAGREGLVRDATDHVRGGSVIEVEITSRKLAIKGETGLLAVPPADSRWIGAGVTFVRRSPGGSSSARLAGVDTGGRAPVRSVSRRRPRAPGVGR
jgi:hypothetical protein